VANRLVATAEQTALLEVREVTKAFPSPDGKGVIQVLSPLSFSVRAEEWVVIVGPSGGGKSTLLRILLGSYPTNIWRGLSAWETIAWCSP
jgi:ABC-type glutathione transport system ATPase component